WTTGPSRSSTSAIAASSSWPGRSVHGRRRARATPRKLQDRDRGPRRGFRGDGAAGVRRSGALCRPWRGPVRGLGDGAFCHSAASRFKRRLDATWAIVRAGYHRTMSDEPSHKAPKGPRRGVGDSPDGSISASRDPQSLPELEAEEEKVPERI